MPAPAAGLELLLEGPGLEASQDLRVGAFSLAIAPGVRHRSVVDLRSKVSTICFEEVTGELRAVIGDDAVGDPETAHEALDELDRGTGWDGADGYHYLYVAIDKFTKWAEVEVMRTIPTGSAVKFIKGIASRCR